jgi:hypothetical protein
MCIEEYIPTFTREEEKMLYTLGFFSLSEIRHKHFTPRNGFIDFKRSLDITRLNAYCSHGPVEISLDLMPIFNLFTFKICLEKMTLHPYSYNTSQIFVPLQQAASVVVKFMLRLRADLTENPHESRPTVVFFKLSGRVATDAQEMARGVKSITPATF